MIDVNISFPKILHVIHGYFLIFDVDIYKCIDGFRITFKVSSNMCKNNVAIVKMVLHKR